MTSEVESDVCIRKRKVKQLSSSDGTESDVCKEKMKVKHLSSDGNDTDLDIFRKKRKVQKLDSESETDEGEKVVTPKRKVQSKKRDAKMKSNVEVKRENNNIFACPQCDFTGKSSGKVYTHMAENHGMAKFECDYCKFRTGNKTLMANHKREYCRELKQELGSMTSNTGPNIEPLKKRVDGKANYLCPKCDFVGLSEGKVYSHLCEVHGAKKFKCTFCNFESANKTSMHNHMKLYCPKVKRSKT